MSDSAPNPPRPFNLSRMLPWALAAMVALAGAWLGQLHLASQAKNALLEDQYRLTDLELRSTRQHAEAERLLARRQLADADQRLAAATHEIAELRKNPPGRAAEGALTIAMLTPTNGDSSSLPRGVAVWNSATQEGILRVEKLPTIAGDQTYHLWVIDPAEPTPLDAGVFGIDAASGNARVAFRLSKPVSNSPKFIVSLERKSGASKPEDPIVLTGE